MNGEQVFPVLGELETLDFVGWIGGGEVVLDCRGPNVDHIDHGAGAYIQFIAGLVPLELATRRDRDTLDLLEMKRFHD